MTYLDVLVPSDPAPGDLLERLLQMGIRDDGASVEPGPMDQATLNLIREVITATDDNLSLELPRGRNDIAVLLGVFLQLMRQGALYKHQYDREGFSGAVAVIGLNTNLTERLRRIKVGPQTLSEGLCAQRVRADGKFADLRGTIREPSERTDWLLYLNTSLGWPALTGTEIGVAVIDRASFRNPETLDRALAWCQAHHAGRIIVINTLGDPLLPGLGAGWIRWPWTPRLRTELFREVGDGPPSGPLSTNCLLSLRTRPVGVATYSAPELFAVRRTCLSGIAAARKTGGPFPRAVADAVQLVNLLGGLWGNVHTANVWAVAEPRGVSAATLTANLSRSNGEDLREGWGLFRETQWSDLRRGALRMAELLTEYNPRLDLLLSLLDWAETNRPGARVVVRTSTRSAAGALAVDLVAARPSLVDWLGDADPTLAQLQVLPYSDRGPWARSPVVEFHLGVPAPWRRSSLLSAEASEHIVAIDRHEEPWLRASMNAVIVDLRDTVAAAAQTLSLAGVPTGQVQHLSPVYGPVRIDDRGDDDDDELEVVTAPALDLAGLFDDYCAAVSQVTGEDDPDNTTATSGRPTSARPITLEPDGALYWLPGTASAEVLIGNRYSSTPVSALSPGMTLIIPRGESRDDLYKRLLRAAHQESDVLAVEMILRRFRKAVWELHDRFDSWDGVARELRKQGSVVTTGATCAAWARGSVIAPEDVADIRRVGRLAWDDSLIVDRTWERIGAVARQLRRLHQGLGHLLSAAIGEVASGRGGPYLQKLSDLCDGIDPTEILEEFDMRQIRSIGISCVIPSSQLRRLSTPHPRALTLQEPR